MLQINRRKPAFLVLSDLLLDTAPLGPAGENSHRARPAHGRRGRELVKQAESRSSQADAAAKVSVRGGVASAGANATCAQLSTGLQGMVPPADAINHFVPLKRIYCPLGPLYYDFIGSHAGFRLLRPLGA